MLNIHPFRQKKDHDCGPACIKMLADFYHKKVDYDSMLEVSSKLDGYTLDRMKDTFKELGIRTKKKEGLDLCDLKENYEKGKPTIVIWFNMYTFYPGNHYSIVVKVTDKLIYLADPGIGKIRKMDKEKFSCLWFGINPFSTEFTEHPSTVYWIRAGLTF